MAICPSFWASAHFRLLDLPAEIREYIFEFALVSEKPVVTFRLDNYQRESYREATQPALTRVSRQIRQESLQVFYRVNCFIFHTEEPRFHESLKWARQHERMLAKMLRMSFWVRHVTLTNDRDASNGAMCIPLWRGHAEGEWSVDEAWQWITVTRKPAAIQSDVGFIFTTLRALLRDDPACLRGADGMSALIKDLRSMYIKEKMS